MCCPGKGCLERFLDCGVERVWSFSSLRLRARMRTRILTGAFNCSRYERKGNPLTKLPDGEMTPPRMPRSRGSRLLRMQGKTTSGQRSKDACFTISHYLGASGFFKGGSDGFGRAGAGGALSGTVRGGIAPADGTGGLIEAPAALKLGLASGLVGVTAATAGSFCSLGAPCSSSKSRYFGSTRSIGMVTAGGGLGCAPFSAFC